MAKVATLTCQNKRHPVSLYPSHIILRTESCDIIEATHDITQAIVFPGEVWWELFGLLSEKIQHEYEWWVVDRETKRKIRYCYYDLMPGYMKSDQLHYVKQLDIDVKNTLIAEEILEETIYEKEALLFTTKTWNNLLEQYHGEKQLRFVSSI